MSRSAAKAAGRSRSGGLTTDPASVNRRGVAAPRFSFVQRTVGVGPAGPTRGGVFAAASGIGKMLESWTAVPVPGEDAGPDRAGTRDPHKRTVVKNPG